MCKILGMLVNTLTDNDKYYLLSRHNLTQQIQMQFPQKNFFSLSFSVFLKSALNFEYFLKEDDSHSLCISEIADCEISG